MKVRIEHRLTLVRYKEEFIDEEWEDAIQAGAQQILYCERPALLQYVYRLVAENGVCKQEMSWREMAQGEYTLPDEAFPFPDTTEGDPAYFNSREYHEYLERHGVV